MTPSSSDMSWAIYKRLLGFTTTYRKGLVLGFIGFFIYAQTQWIWAQLIDYIFSAIQSHSHKLKIVLPFAIFTIFVVRGAGSFIGNYGIAYVARHVMHHLREQLFNHLLKLDAYYYDQNTSGQILTKLTYNIEQVSGAASDALKTLLEEGLTVIGLLIFLFYKNWQLSSLFLIIAPLVGIVVNSVSRRLNRLGRKIQDAMAEITHVTKESVQAYRTIKTFGAENYEQSRFAKANDNNLKQNLKWVIAESVATPTVQCLVALCLAVLVWIALQPQFLGTTSAGEFIAYITAAGLIVKPMRQLTQVNALIQRGIVGATSIFELLDTPTEYDPGTQKIARAQGKIEFKNVSFRYPGKEEWVLRNISFTVEPGQTVALVGKSGGGKSTLVSLLARFYLPTEGEILLDDISIDRLVLADVRRQFSLVSQQLDLFDDTIANNIAYGREDATLEQIEQAAQSANALGFIQQFPEGMSTQIGEIGLRISGGQRQRIAIARALLKDAPILILDEATSALDNESEKLIQQALQQVMQQRTTFVIAHRLSTIESADCILVMDQGCIVERGTHSVLMQQQGAYMQLHSAMAREVQ